MPNRFNLTILLLFILASCTVLRKHKSSEQRTTDSVQVQTVDTTRTVKRDSTATSSAQAQSWWQTDTATANEQTTITETITETAYDTSGRKKSEKKTQRILNTQRQADRKTAAGTAVELAVAHAAIHAEDVKKGEGESVVQVAKTEQVVSKEKKKTMFPIWLLLLILAGALYWLWRRYRSFKLPL